MRSWRIPNPYRGLKGLPAEIWIIAAATLVNRAGMMALTFLVLYLTRYLHVPAAVAGLAITVYGVGGFVTAPMAGRLADRVGPFTVLRASLALTGGILLVIPFARNLTVVFALVFVWALAADAARPATMSALTGFASPGQRKAAIALNRLAINLGMGVGYAAGGFIAMVSYPLLFWVDGATSLAAAAVLSMLLYARHRWIGATPAQQRERAAARTALFSGSSVVWRDPAALLLIVTSIGVNFVFTQHQGAMPLYLVRDLAYPESFFGALLVLNTLIIVAIEVPLNVAMAHWPARRAITLAALCVAVGFGALAVARSPWAVALTVVIWTFGEMIFYPAATAHVAHLAPEGRTGEYMGAFASTFSAALIIGPWAGVALLDGFGARFTWLFMLGCGLLATALAARPERQERR